MLELAIQLLVVGVPAAVAVFSAWWAARSARKASAAEHEAQRLRALEDRVAEKKYALYQPFLQVFSDVLTPDRSDSATKKLPDAVADFQAFVTVWASDEVVEAFFRFRLASSTEPPVGITMRLMAELLLAIRRDVAWPRSAMTGIQAIGMRINDLPEHPELADDLAMPLPELFAKYDWQAPFVL